MIPPQVVYAIDRLKMARSILGVTVESMQLTGTRGYWSNFENMRTEPRISTMVKYADAIGVPLSVVFRGCPDSNGAAGVTDEEIKKRGAKIFGKSAESTSLNWLWMAICLSEHSEQWASTCKKWIEGEESRRGAVRESIKKGRERLGLHPLPWWCVYVGSECYVFNSEAEAKAHSKKGGASHKVVKIQDFVKWFAKLKGIHRFHTGRGIFDLRDFLQVVLVMEVGVENDIEE